MSGQTSLGKVLSRALDANLRYTALATKLATSAMESAFSVVAEIGPQLDAIRQATSTGQVQPQPKEAAPAPAAILLEGVAGSVAVGFFVVENSLQHEISTPIEVSALAAPDGREIQSALRFEPGRITLAAGQQVVARVSAKISRRLVAGERYVGEIRVPGVEGAQVPIVLRRKADAPRDAAPPERTPTAVSEKSTRGKTSISANKRRTPAASRSSK